MNAGPEIAIRAVADGDVDAIARIYNYYVRETIVTFEEEPVSSALMAARIDEVLSFSLPWLVAEEAGRIVGYAYATKWKGRVGYRFCVETTVYLDKGMAGRGVGTRLYQALFAALRNKSIHAAIGGVALPNDASVKLHEKLGMRKVAHFKEVGFKFGRWIDVAYWEAIL